MSHIGMDQMMGKGR